MIMWSAVILRILENGSTRSPGQGSTVGWTTGPVDGTGDGGRGTGAVAGALAPVSMKPRMSCLVTRPANPVPGMVRSEEHTSELQSRPHLVCRLLLEKKKHYPSRASRGHIIR